MNGVTVIQEPAKELKHVVLPSNGLSRRLEIDQISGGDLRVCVYPPKGRVMLVYAVAHLKRCRIERNGYDGNACLWLDRCAFDMTNDDASAIASKFDVPVQS